MTINSPAAVIWAMYLAVAEKQGADWKKISGTLQNDILKEYIAQKEYIYPPEPSMRLVIDTFEFGVKNTPKFNTISISGYHIREAGSTAIQELAFTLRDGMEYVEWGLRRGLEIDEFAPQLSFFFSAHSDAGAGCGSRRYAVSPHQFARRSLGAANGICGHDRFAHAANHRARNRRTEYGRSAGRVVFCRDADQRSRTRSVGLH